MLALSVPATTSPFGEMARARMSSLVSANSLAWSPTKRMTLRPVPVATRTLPSFCATAALAVASPAGSGAFESIQPARTTPSDPTLAPLRSPPESFSIESSSNVRVPTAPASRPTATVATSVARATTVQHAPDPPKRMGEVLSWVRRGQQLGEGCAGGRIVVDRQVEQGADRGRDVGQVVLAQRP